jgi:hypothetical protein
MPNFDVRFEAQRLRAGRCYYAETISECIDKSIETEGVDWVGIIYRIELTEVKSK